MKYNTIEFIKKAKEIHKNKYDYSLVEYKSLKKNIIVICPIHGQFIQRAGLHLITNGCNECNIDNKIYHKRKKTKEKFIEESNIIHNNIYSYKKVKYINNKTKVIITCPVHGDFEQKPLQHLNLHQGCKKCMIETYTKTKEKFIEESNIIHNNIYSYKKVKYINNKIKVIITCPVHGDFEQKPDAHLNGSGCLKCGNIKKRLSHIKRIEKNKLNGYQLTPNFNPKACKIFNNISEKNNIHIQHAMNGGEYYLKELGYWVDGYDKENNTVYEFDEKHHKYQKEKDLVREQEIINLLKCKFIRIKE